MLRAALIPFLLAGILTLLCLLAGGRSLGLYFGGAIFAALTAPPLTLANKKFLPRFFAAAGVVDGVGLVWILSLIGTDTTLLQWLACYCVLLAFVGAAAGLALLLARRFENAIASALAVSVGLIWFSWPVWLSPALEGKTQLVRWLVAAHPIFAINASLKHLGIWTEQSIAYWMTNLGQDVSYSLPASVLPAVIVHGALAIMMWKLSIVREDAAPADR